MSDKQKLNAGGPAFPLQSIGPEFAPGYAGMTLRDYFAGQALAGILSQTGACSTDYTGMNAQIAYANADAMLAAREAHHE